MPGRSVRGVHLAAAIATCLSLAQSATADPLHKVGSADAYQHEDSGWLFPRELGGFSRVVLPYTIDGNNDVGARYERVAEGVRSTVAVDIYAADSAAAAAKREGAKAAVQRGADPAAIVRVVSEEPFSIAAQRGLDGIKVTFAVDGPDGRSQALLYFVGTERWTVSIAAFLSAETAPAVEAIDRFVRDQPWHTLGSDPPDLHGARR